MKRKPLTKLQKFARGKPCMLRVPGVCRPAPENENTCLCHAPHPNRGGLRKDDQWGAVGCEPCHSWIDGRTHQEANAAYVYSYWMSAIFEWQGMLMEHDLMTVEGVETVTKLLPRRY